MMRIIETLHLRLEPQLAAHAPEMFKVLSDPAIYEFENEPPSSVAWLSSRFARLESRRSADGREQWLNWVIRVSNSDLIGFVQATLKPNGCAEIAFVLSSAYWGQGLAFEASRAMIAELVTCYGVQTLLAVLKRENRRSRQLLERLGFSVAVSERFTRSDIEPDELLMVREV